jgi:membrane-associated protein
MFDVTHILQSGGLLVLALIVFAEVAFFIGTILPGDTLLIAAGIYAHQGKLPILAVIAVCAAAAIVGDSVAYFTGRKFGTKIFSKPDGIIFRQDHIKRAEKFYDRFGAKTLLIAHFIPVVRSFTPLLAGVASMPFKRFISFTFTGDTLWGITIPLLGYYVGSRIPNIDSYIMVGLGLAILTTLAPALVHVLKTRRAH